MALGRRGPTVAHEGDLVLVEVAPGGGRARVVERLGSPWDVRALLHGLAGEAGAALPFPAAAEAEALDLPRDPAPPTGDRRDLRDRVAFTVDPERPRTTTTRSRWSAPVTVCACSCTSPT